jgi:hypothetical protein
LRAHLPEQANPQPPALVGISAATLGISAADHMSSYPLTFRQAYF